MQDTGTSTDLVGSRVLRTSTFENAETDHQYNPYSILIHAEPDIALCFNN